MPDLGNPLPRRENTLKRTGIVCIRQRYDSRYPYPVLSRPPAIRLSVELRLQYRRGNHPRHLSRKSKSCRARGTVSKHRFTERQQLTNNCGLESLNRQRYPRIRPNSGRIHPTMEKYRIAFEDALRASCQKAVRYPKETIHSLEEHGIFAQGALTPESIERCKIHYLSAIEAKNAVMDFLRLIEQYEPKAVGGRLPDAGFIPEKQ